MIHEEEITPAARFALAKLKERNILDQFLFNATHPTSKGWMGLEEALKEDGDAFDLIDRAMVWSHTPEDHEFWSQTGHTINQEWRQYRATN